MKYFLRVSVEISSTENVGYNPLRLSEEKNIELNSLSDAALILVKLHDFFEALKSAKV